MVPFTYSTISLRKSNLELEVGGVRRAQAVVQREGDAPGP